MKTKTKISKLDKRINKIIDFAIIREEHIPEFIEDVPEFIEDVFNKIKDLKADELKEEFMNTANSIQKDFFNKDKEVINFAQIIKEDLDKINIKIWLKDGSVIFTDDIQSISINKDNTNEDDD